MYNRKTRYRKTGTDESIVVFPYASNNVKTMYKVVEVVTPSGIWIYLPGLRTMRTEDFKRDYTKWRY